MTLVEALRLGAARFTDSDSRELDAQLLLGHVLKVARSRFYSHPEQQLSDNQLTAYNALCERRAAGEPLAYLTGTRSFWSLELTVAPGVLIPRPETELLVELALELGSNASMTVADLGTGSGGIALALASERPLWQVWATELHDAACLIAANNIRLSGLKNITLKQGSWCEPLQGQAFDMLVANPPYIAATDPHLRQGDLRFEPHTALVADNQGLADLASICVQAMPLLNSGGWLLVEHGWEQAAPVRAILEKAGYAQISTSRDNAGRDRVSMGCKKVQAHAR